MYRLLRIGVSGITVGFAIIVAVSPSKCSAAAPSPASSQPKLDFNRDVRPILADACFKCHGFDDKTRQAGLRLDERDHALKTLESGDVAVVPGKPERSALVERIFSTDDATRMPPPDSGKSLTAAHRETLRRWIAEGAEFKKHWSFETPVRPAVPATSNTAWPRNEIDRFILARLESEGLAPSPEADAVTLCRRLYLDLTGLPPTPADVDAFLADRRPNRYEALVDKLLASPHYGERMAVEWLDAARYADTHGYHIDSHRDMWPWRQWVIEAFNSNLPFDQFTVQQLAGDLLPKSGDPLKDQRQVLACGFNRNHMINFEGGAIPEEYHNAYIVDRVNTTGMVWLGLSIGCAQCHSHKYDPITQRDYYRLYAFFHNVPENGLDGRKGNAAPTLSLATPQQSERLAELTSKIASLEKALNDPNPQLDAAQADWEKTALERNKTKWTVLKVVDSRGENGVRLTQAADGAVSAARPPANVETYTVAAIVDVQDVTALRLEALMPTDKIGRGPGRSDDGNFVLTDVRCDVAPVLEPTQLKPVRFKAASADFSQKGFDVARAVDGDKRSGWGVLPEVGKEHTAVFEFAAPQAVSGAMLMRVTLDFQSEFPQHMLARFRLAVTDSKDPHDRQALPDAVVKALEIAADKRTAEQKTELRRHFRTKVSPKLSEAATELAKLQREKTELELSIPTAMVMQEMPQPRETFVLVRGAYDKKSEKVSAGVPDVLLPFPKKAPANRLGLAQWLVDPRHPLTARVAVNRYWQTLFGTGLVKTAEDFGQQGEWPSHPELLDWLATDFVAHGWDVKRTIRAIVTSAAYRQSSAVTPALLARDPENRLLARGPRFRLQAEFIRDQALAASGLLNAKIGGPSVYPYQPEDLWDELAYGGGYSAQKFALSKGADLYRRSMYTFWKRTVPPPQLNTFDAPDRETCTVRRARTNTPLQALILMNDPTYVEAARKLAERAMTEAGSTTEDRIRYVFRLVLARQPRVEEVDVLAKVYERQLAAYRGDQAAATKLLAVGQSPRNDKLDVAELAAWTMTAEVVLNVDEAVTRN